MMVSLSAPPWSLPSEELAKVKSIRLLVNVMANEIDLHNHIFEFTSGFRTRATTEQKKMIGDPMSGHSTTVSTVANSIFDFNPPPAELQDLLFKTRAMRKRKATESGLRGVELVGALHTLIELRDVLLREQRQGRKRRQGMANGRAVKKEEQTRLMKDLQRDLF